MVDGVKLIELLNKIGDKIIEEKEFLTELDAPIGDSDHGINMAKGFTEVKKKLPDMSGQDVGTIFKNVGMVLVSTVGGSSGPLYGTAFMKMGMTLTGKKEVDFSEFMEGFKAGVEGVKQRGRSTTGEKTMLDAMVPAMDAMNAAYAEKPDAKTAFLAGVKAAEAGVEYTKTIIATKGRASYVGERSIGHQDPGATSFMFMLRVAAENL
ncbi:MAG: dihydroxyacetone kinase subunit DhaL [Clostridium sp.]